MTVVAVSTYMLTKQLEVLHSASGVKRRFTYFVFWCIVCFPFLDCLCIVMWFHDFWYCQGSKGHLVLETSFCYMAVSRLLLWTMFAMLDYYKIQRQQMHYHQAPLLYKKNDACVTKVLPKLPDILPRSGHPKINPTSRPVHSRQQETAI